MVESLANAIEPSSVRWGGSLPKAYPRPEVHKKMLKAFHKCLIGDSTLFVFSRLHDDLWEFYKENPWLLPESVHRKSLRQPLAEGDPDNWGHWDWPEVFIMADPFSRSSSWKCFSSMKPLLDLNELGYDIQIPVNPLTCKIRGQKTVAICKNILAEADEGTIEDQLIALKPFRNEIVSILDTGSRGAHAVFRLNRWIKNPYKLDWKRARKAQDKHDLRNPIPEFVDAAGDLKDRLINAGFKPDPKAIVDHSRLTRLPGFRHGKTGRIAELIYLNPHASKGVPTARPIISPKLELLWSSDRSVSMSPTISSDKEYSFNVEDGELQRDAGGSQKGLGESVKECGGLVPVNVYMYGPETAPRPPSVPYGQSNFLADWAIYQRLKSQGIPERHTRIKLHMPMFTMATVFGWDDARLAEEWRKIVSISPGCIGCGEDEAIKDILAAWASRSRHEPIRLPDLVELQDLDEPKTQALLEALKDAGCPNPKIATRLVAEILIPLGRMLPAQSKDGSLGLKSKDMLERFGPNYRIAREGLVQAGLLEVTSRSYMPKKQTMQYRVCWARLLILCGFKAEELKWHEEAVAISALSA